MAETEEETPDRTFRTYGSESGRPASHLSDGSGREPTRSAAKVAAMPGSWWLGTMPRLLKAADRGGPAVIFVDECLRGVSQAFFLNNPVTGVVALCASFQHSWVAGVCATVGVSAATITAHALVVDPGALRNGLYGMSGFLLGQALALFSTFESTVAPPPSLLVALAVLASLSSFLTNAAGNFIVPTFGVVPLALPFVATAYAWLLACSGGLLAYFPVNGAVIQPALPPPNPRDGAAVEVVEYDTKALGRALLVTIGNTAFSPSEYSGAGFVAAVLLSSPTTAAMMILGACVAVALQVASGVSPSLVSTGLLGFNTVLTCMALGGFFLVVRGWRVWLSLLVGALYSYLLSAALWNLLSPVGLPALGTPFTLTAGSIRMDRRTTREVL